MLVRCASGRCGDVFKGSRSQPYVAPWASPDGGCITGSEGTLRQTLDGPRLDHGLLMDNRSRHLHRPRAWCAGSAGSSRHTSVPNAEPSRSSGSLIGSELRTFRSHGRSTVYFGGMALAQSEPIGLEEHRILRSVPAKGMLFINWTWWAHGICMAAFVSMGSTQPRRGVVHAPRAAARNCTSGSTVSSPASHSGPPRPSRAP